MNTSQKFFWKLLLFIEIPIILVIYGVSFVWMYLIKSFFEELEKSPLIENTTLGLLSLALIAITFMIVMALKVTLNRIGEKEKNK